MLFGFDLHSIMSHIRKGKHRKWKNLIATWLFNCHNEIIHIWPVLLDRLSWIKHPLFSCKIHDDAEDYEERQWSAEKSSAFHLKEHIDKAIKDTRREGECTGNLGLKESVEVSSKGTGCHSRCNQICPSEWKIFTDWKQEEIEQAQRQSCYDILYNIDLALGYWLHQKDDNLDREMAELYQ